MSETSESGRPVVTVDIRGEPHRFVCSDPTMVVPMLCAALLALEDPRVDAVFAAFRFGLLDGDGASVLPLAPPAPDDGGESR